MDNSKKIALLYPYYGKFPWYFKFFIESCKYNPSVDFIIFTDIKINEELPKNIIVIEYSFLELKKLISEKMGFSVSLNSPYKLCDFKPAYGVIFSEFITDYDFWGHGDIDLIFGNIRTFMTDEVLDNFDVICVRDEYVTGFFTLFRNNEFVNKLYEESKDYKFVFQNEKNFVFDECGNLFSELQAGESIFELESEIETMTHVIKRLNQEEKIRAYFDFFVVEGIPGNLLWDNGTLSFKDQYEILLYHLITFKNFPHFVPFFWKKVPSKFYIGKNYFSSYPENSARIKFYKIFFQFYLSILNLKEAFLRWLENLKTATLLFFNKNAYDVTEVVIIIDNKKTRKVKRLEKKQIEGNASKEIFGIK